MNSLEDTPPPPYSPPSFENPQPSVPTLLVLATDVLKSIQTAVLNCCVCMGICFGA